MPELPEVETTVRGLARVLGGQRIAALRLNRPDLRRPFPADLIQAMTGATVTGLGRRAKYGLVHTDRARTLVFHLGMSGRWRIDPENADRHDHLVLHTVSGHVLALNDPRRFGSVDLVDSPTLGLWPPFAAMGPEPLGDDFTPASLHRALAGRSAAIKLLLLDQRIVAGLGNIYVCEALHMAGISPRLRGGAISKPRYERLVAAIKRVLIAAIAAGGSSLRDFAQPSGELGYFAKDWLVYGREGEVCQCGALVRRRVDSGRSTFYCSQCQK